MSVWAISTRCKNFISCSLLGFFYFERLSLIYLISEATSVVDQFRQDLLNGAFRTTKSSNTPAFQLILYPSPDHVIHRCGIRTTKYPRSFLDYINPFFLKKLNCSDPSISGSKALVESEVFLRIERRKTEKRSRVFLDAVLGVDFSPFCTHYNLVFLFLDTLAQAMSP